jgi:hypothetical protein
VPGLKDRKTNFRVTWCIDQFSKVVYYHPMIFKNKYHVHHVDGNRENNSDSNLVRIPDMLHSYIHTMIRHTGIRPNKDEIEQKLLPEFNLKHSKLEKEQKETIKRLRIIQIELQRLSNFLD